jgi:putative ABC transport system substrate-binding protein
MRRRTQSAFGWQGTNMQFDQLKRREFITWLAGAVAARPLAARAQPGDRVRRIGVLMPTSGADIERQAQLKAFRDTLAGLGWIEGRNVAFDYRWTGASSDLVRGYAKELVALAPDLLLTQSVQLVAALRDETRTIPILFGGGSDPIEVGLVESLARPGGNITGFMSIAAASNVKYLELLKELDPRVSRVLVLMSSKDPSNDGRTRGIEAGGPSLKVDVSKADVLILPDIERAIGDFAAHPAGALIMLPNPVTNTHHLAIIALAVQHRVPAIYPFRYLAVAGGLVAYGADQHDQYSRAASYADRILKGENPGSLPIQAPTKFELVINLKTANAIRLEIPPMLLARADEVIE